MIEKPTVFVLGAGASSAFGFPMGRVLRDKIVTSLDDQNGVLGALFQYYGYERYENPDQWRWTRVDESPLKSQEEILKEVVAFKLALLNSPLLSIDAFLERRPEFEKTGKIAIASKLIPHEQKPNLMRRPKQKPRWTDVLFSKLDTDPADFAKNKLSIITFNYDRSLEYFLWYAFMYTYDLNEEDAAHLLETISIVHIHGQLGKPHFLADNGRDYKTDVNCDSLRTAVDNMRIIYEQPDESPELQQAREMIAQAEILCFLGFGYHPENMRRLAIRDHFRGRRLLGSCFKMETNERRVVGSRFTYIESQSTGSISYGVGGKKFFHMALGKQDEDAYIFLRRYRVFDQ